MKQCILFTLLLLNAWVGNAQKAKDFTVTDSDGVEHQLYASHLDNGQTVVVELFFVECPPCRSAAPNVQKIYEQWGGGDADVEFIKISTMNSNSNADVAQFKKTYGTRFPGVGYDGGAVSAREQFMDGTFGSFYGTPQFDVIAPDGSVTHAVPLSRLNDFIEKTGATGETTVTPPPPTNTDTFSVVQVAHQKIRSITLPEKIEYFLQDSAQTVSYNITALTNGTNQFEYPSAKFPKLDNPIITAEAKGPARDKSVKVTDLLVLNKHILEIEKFREDGQFIAGDMNNDNKVNALDLLVLNKLILEYTHEFPNGTKNWKTSPRAIPLAKNSDTPIEVNFTFYKTGDLNYIYN